jgi:hypothetical protein
MTEEQAKIINHEEARELALIKQEESNLARAYLDLRSRIAELEVEVERLRTAMEQQQDYYRGERDRQRQRISGLEQRYAKLREAVELLVRHAHDPDLVEAIGHYRYIGESEWRLDAKSIVAAAARRALGLQTVLPGVAMPQVENIKREFAFVVPLIEAAQQWSGYCLCTCQGSRMRRPTKCTCQLAEGRVRDEEETS